MREIKFRAWDKKKSDWEDCFFYVAKNGKSVIFDDEFTMDISGDYILQQFTGLHDKNGKEIYEGDILRGTRVDGEQRHYKVWGDEGGFCINSFVSDFYKEPKDIAFYSGLSDMQNASFVKGNCEVIGNIFENPEMLKQ